MDNSQEQKAAFAAFLFAETGSNRPFLAACRLYPNKSDTGMAAYIAANWPNDEFVMAELSRLQQEAKETEENGLSEKRMIEILTEIAEDEHAMKKDKIAAIKLIGELKGIGKNNGGTDADRVMPKMPVYKVVNA